MGHGVRIESRDESLYVSFNWHDMMKIYGGVHEMHGHKGKTVAKICWKIIQRLMSEGVAMPDRNTYQKTPNYIYGRTHDASEELPQDTRKGIYMFIMFDFLEFALQFPENRFFSDSVYSGIKPFHDDTDNYTSDGDEGGVKLSVKDLDDDDNEHKTDQQSTN